MTYPPGEPMRCLLIYDIPDDRVRQRIADACLDYGLQRIQYSAFSGDLSRTYQRALFTEIRRRLGGRDGNVQFFPLDEGSWQGRRVIAKGGDRG
jgi:CRISPR-associated protein Cas2